MRRIIPSFLALALVGGLFTFLASPASAGDCPVGEVEVRGRVTDAATGLPLDVTTSVEIQGVSSPSYMDGVGTTPNSRWTTCLPIGTYKIKFVADTYRSEWSHNRPNEAAADVITVTGPDAVVVNEGLAPKGLVVAGRVTNVPGAPKFASVGIWRLTSTGWKPYDGIGNDEASGWYEFRAPGPGRYRIMASVDHHWEQWATSASRMSRARTFTLNASTPLITNGHIQVPYCTSSSGEFCTPPGFLT
jgi:hypothetical protein